MEDYSLLLISRGHKEGVELLLPDGNIILVQMMWFSQIQEFKVAIMAPKPVRIRRKNVDEIKELFKKWYFLPKFGDKYREDFNGGI